MTEFYSKHIQRVNHFLVISKFQYYLFLDVTKYVLILYITIFIHLLIMQVKRFMLANEVFRLYIHTYIIISYKILSVPGQLILKIFSLLGLAAIWLLEQKLICSIESKPFNTDGRTQRKGNSASLLYFILAKCLCI